MPSFKRARRAIIASSIVVSSGMLGATAIGAPTVQQVSGALSHKASVTITGSGFGTKAQAAPLVWDDASGTSMLSKWTAAWPDSGDSAYYTTYRNPQRGVPLPHSHSTKYIAGAHGGGTSDGGYAVGFWKTFQKSEFVYLSWYERADPAWSFGGDNNYKTLVYSIGSSTAMYPSEGYWYLAFGPPTPTPIGDPTYPFPQWVVDGQLENPDKNGHNVWWAWSLRHPMVSWAKIEVAIKVSSGSDGYIKQWEDGRLAINYVGRTDWWSGSTRNATIGGYARNYNKPSNWRYFADAYVDSTLSRVVLANNANLSVATVIENQIPTAWGNGSISITANLGKFSSGQTAYLFVADSTGAMNSAGFPVTISGSIVTPKSPDDVVAE